MAILTTDEVSQLPGSREVDNIIEALSSVYNFLDYAEERVESDELRGHMTTLQTLAQQLTSLANDFYGVVCASEQREEEEDCCPNCDRPLSEGGGAGLDTDFCQECEDALAEEEENDLS